MDRIRYSYENMNIIKLDYISRKREKIFYKKVNIFARFWIEETWWSYFTKTISIMFSKKEQELCQS